jgi:hypothetical protein
MPTVLGQGAFAFMVYTDDHRPMHVHVWHQGREAVLTIEKGVHIRENSGMTRRDLRTAVKIAEENLRFLQAEWDRIYER